MSRSVAGRDDGADRRCDLGGVAVDGLLYQGRGQAAPVDLAEEPVEAEDLVSVEDLLDQLGAGRS
jgi:hypothetical protein